MIDPPRHCGECAVFALLEDVIRSALQGGLGQPMRVPEALPPRVLGKRTDLTSFHDETRLQQAGIERLAKVRATLYGRLAAIDRARKGITAIARDGDGVATAVQVEVRHQCGIIAKETKRARETLAGTGLHR